VTTPLSPFAKSSSGPSLPEEGFEPIFDEDLTEASEALARAGINIESLHARWARILVEEIGKLAREGLAAEERRKVVH
jgi:hypothetical protein